MNYCKEHKIDCSGTHIFRYHRRYTYALVKSDSCKKILDVTFHKSQIPTYLVYKIEKDYNCKKCGNPKTMYWCGHCESNGEMKVCDRCGGVSKLDNGYHKDCK